MKFKHKVVSKPEEIVLDKSMYAEAAANKMTFSQYLERIQPTQAGDTLDAFERQLKRFGIVVKSQPEKGIYASTIEQFLKASETYGNNNPLQTNVPSSAILFPEFVSRTLEWLC